MKKKYAALAGSAAVALTTLAGVSTLGTGPASASCPTSWSTVQNADWLKVHTKPGTTTPVVGQLQDGTRFTYIVNSSCEVQGANANGLYWEYGYGYNGSTKLTGWVAAEYLAHP